MGDRRRSRSPSDRRFDQRRDYNPNYVSSQPTRDIYSSSGYPESSRSTAPPRGQGGGYGRSDRGRAGGFRGGRGATALCEPLQPLPNHVVPPNGKDIPVTAVNPRNANGTQIMVEVNHFLVKTLPFSAPIFCYDVKIEVSADSVRPHKPQKEGEQMNKALAHQVARTLLHSETQRLLGPEFVFDGVSQGWSPVSKGEVGQVLSVTLDMGMRRDKLPNNVDLKIRRTGQLNIGELVKALQSGQATYPVPNLEPFAKWLNALHRKEPQSRFITRPNQNVYFERSPSTATALASTGGILEALRGFFATVMVRFGQLTVNVDSSTTPFWVPDKSLLEIAGAYAGVRDLSALGDHHWQQTSTRIRQIYCVAPHLKSDKKIKPKGLEHETALTHTFNCNGEKVTCRDYYLSKYNIKLRYPHYPLVSCKDGLFPMELLRSAPGERYKELLQGAETADFIAFSCAPPDLRRYHVEESLRKLNWHAQPLLSSHGVAISPRFLQVKALILDPPQIKYAGLLQVASGKWNLRGVRLNLPVRINSWGLMQFGRGQMGNFGPVLLRSFSVVNMGIPSNLPTFVQGNPQGDIEAGIAQLIAQTTQEFRQKPDLLLFILQDDNAEVYKRIKVCCEIGHGVASQCMLAAKALKERGQDQYLANIALKVNVKLGGRNSVFLNPSLNAKKFMYIGADTSHPSPAQLRMDNPPPAISALVGTYDQACCQYTGVAAAQDSRKQLIDPTTFTAMCSELLKRYQQKNNGSLPQNVLFFRDGLSESQFGAIKTQEARALKDLLLKADPTGAVKLTTILAIKRHHTRIFPLDDNKDEKGNVLPGTVVENSSTHNDIFLVSHASLQGTNRPTRYLVLQDEENIPAAAFQNLLNEMCSSYARATRSVAVVPAVYYADQLAARAGLWVQKGLPDPQGNVPMVVKPLHENLKFTMNWQ